MGQTNYFSKSCLFIRLIPLLIILLTSCEKKNTIYDNDPYKNKAEVILKDSISQFGITWYFDKEYETGQFANDDWWVVGSVTIIRIDPASTFEDGRIINGSMINPSPENGNVQGYDNAMYANTYSEEYNAARPNSMDLSENNILVVPVNSSLISTISISEPENRPQLKSAAILTVIDTPPEKGSFRPPYCGIDKAICYNIDQLNKSLLARLKSVPSTPSMADAERLFERPWLDHIPNWSAGNQHPLDNMPDYGREISRDIGIGALMLHLDYTYEEKQILLIRYVQLGIDLYGIIQDGGEVNWVPNGGHASGRKWPILFAGLMLNNYDMMAIGQKSGDYLFADGYGAGNPPPDYIHFGEDGQTFHVTLKDVERTLESNWEDVTGTPYLHSDIGMAEWGIRHSINPAIDNKDWEASYRRCCTANAWSGFVLAAQIMNAKSLWNHDALFDYQDRYMSIEEPQSWTRCWDDFTEEMWDTYRELY